MHQTPDCGLSISISLKLRSSMSHGKSSTWETNAKGVKDVCSF